MLVELRLYQTLATLRIPIQWLPLWAMKPYSCVMSDCWLTELEPIGVVSMFPNCCRALESTWIE